jgi:hypothetical protein
VGRATRSLRRRVTWNFATCLVQNRVTVLRREGGSLISPIEEGLADLRKAESRLLGVGCSMGSCFPINIGRSLQRYHACRAARAPEKRDRPGTGEAALGDDVVRHAARALGVIGPGEAYNDVLPTRDVGQPGVSECRLRCLEDFS